MEGVESQGCQDNVFTMPLSPGDTRTVPVSLPGMFAIVVSAAQGPLHRNLGRNRQGLL